MRKIRSAQWVYWQKGKSLWTTTGGDAEVPVPVTGAWMYSGRSFLVLAPGLGL